MPRLLIVERIGMTVLFVFPFECAVPAQRKYAQRYNFAVLFGMFQESGTEPDRKLIDLEFKDFSGNVMSEFVYGDHGKQYQNRQTHRADRTHHT